MSPGTKAHDRKTKMPLYAEQGVSHAWLIDPLERTLDVYAFTAEGRWSEARRFQGTARVRAEPFDAIELELGMLWTR
jgi:Uma2 family endonuclease